MAKRDKGFEKEAAAVSKQAAETAKKVEQLAKQEAEVCRDGQTQVPSLLMHLESMLLLL